MTLILSDRPLHIPDMDQSTTELIDLSALKIANCVGCFGCWTKTPGKCVIRDDAVRAVRAGGERHELAEIDLNRLAVDRIRICLPLRAWEYAPAPRLRHAFL